MSNLELKSIVKEDSCTNRKRCRTDFTIEDVKYDIRCDSELRRVSTYKLFNDKLRTEIENKLRDNDDLLFCGFVVDHPLEVHFNNSHFNYHYEYNSLKNSFNEDTDNYLSKIVNNRFWFSYLLNSDNSADYINIYGPADRGLYIPKIYAKFVKFEKWMTGCVFVKTHYRIVN